jgi:hypothetical protein
MRFRIALALCAALLGAAGLYGVRLGVAAQSELRPAAPEIEQLVKQAIEDRLAAGDLPDLKLLGTPARIAVGEEMPEAGLKLGPGALPQREGHEFHFISQTAAQRQADRDLRAVHFIAVDVPAITGEVATLRLGVDVALPSRVAQMKMCCCWAQGRFRLADGRWTFVQWLNIYCP